MGIGMEPLNMRFVGPTKLLNKNPSSNPDDVAAGGLLIRHLRDGIAELLLKWNALQMAVENQWGGPDSLHKSRLLAAHILSSLSPSHNNKESIPRLEDLENMLHENMLLAFNTEIEDGSIEEVAEQLMILHDEFLQSSKLTS